MENTAEFQVKPQVLLQSAKRMETSVKKAEKAVERWDELSKKTSACLAGRIGDAFRQESAKVASEWRQKTEILLEMVSGLEEIACIYEKTEGENLDVIYRTGN